MSEKAEMAAQAGQPPAYTQQPQGYGPPQTIIVQPYAWGRAPVPVNCTSCNQPITTELEYETGTVTWLACLGISMAGLWCGCCLAPFYLDSCKDAIHKCPQCKAVIGRKDLL